MLSGTTTRPARSAPTLATTTGTQSLYRPFISVSGSTVRVVETRYAFPTGDFTQDIEWTSTNGGSSFDAGHEIGTLDYINEGVFDTDGTFTGVTNANSSVVPGTATGGATLGRGLNASGAQKTVNLLPGDTSLLAERLKELTRGKSITREAIAQFIATLEIPAAERERLLALTPGRYTGHAAALAKKIP